MSSGFDAIYSGRQGVSNGDIRLLESRNIYKYL